ncbi:hypothetical protein PG984_003557 [Apiospora sp. TS-2023a]
MPRRIFYPSFKAAGKFDQWTADKGEKKRWVKLWVTLPTDRFHQARDASYGFHLKDSWNPLVIRVPGTIDGVEFKVLEDWERNKPIRDETSPSNISTNGERHVGPVGSRRGSDTPERERGGKHRHTRHISNEYHGNKPVAGPDNGIGNQAKPKRRSSRAIKDCKPYIEIKPGEWGVKRRQPDKQEFLEDWLQADPDGQTYLERDHIERLRDRSGTMNLSPRHHTWPLYHGGQYNELPAEEKHHESVPYDSTQSFPAYLREPPSRHSTAPSNPCHPQKYEYNAPYCATTPNLQQRQTGTPMMGHFPHIPPPYRSRTASVKPSGWNGFSPRVGLDPRKIDVNSFTYAGEVVYPLPDTEAISSKRPA